MSCEAVDTAKLSIMATIAGYCKKNAIDAKTFSERTGSHQDTLHYIGAFKRQCYSLQTLVKYAHAIGLEIHVSAERKAESDFKEYLKRVPILFYAPNDLDEIIGDMRVKPRFENYWESIVTYLLNESNFEQELKKAVSVFPEQKEEITMELKATYTQALKLIYKIQLS